MKFKCAICGFEGPAVVWETWYRSEASMPQVWICDIHRSEFICTREEEYDPDEV